MRLVLATGNPGKLAELQALLAPFDCQSQVELGIPEIEETGLSFVENAILKARHAATYTGCPCLADDSGLVVPALGGEPGIYSARYAGSSAKSSENIAKLLENMRALTGEDRAAYFYCCLALVRHAQDPCPILCFGRMEGSIAYAPQGTEGFGYDPIFLLADQQISLAEIPFAAKNSISHRAQALKQLQQNLSLLE